MIEVEPDTDLKLYERSHQEDIFRDDDSESEEEEDEYGEKRRRWVQITLISSNIIITTFQHLCQV